MSASVEEGEMYDWYWMIRACFSGEVSPESFREEIRSHWRAKIMEKRRYLPRFFSLSMREREKLEKITTEVVSDLSSYFKEGMEKRAWEHAHKEVEMKLMTLVPEGDKRASSYLAPPIGHGGCAVQHRRLDADVEIVVNRTPVKLKYKVSCSRIERLSVGGEILSLENLNTKELQELLSRIS